MKPVLERDNPFSDTPSIAGARAALNQVKLLAFDVAPGTIRPFQAAQVSWSVELGGGGGEITLALAGQRVDARGSLAIHPRESTTLSLTASSGTVTRVLGTRAVHVDTGACFLLDFGVEDFQTALELALQALVAKHPRLRVNHARASIDPGGIGFDVSLHVSVDDFPDPDVSGHVRFQLRVVDGKLLADVIQIGSSFDLPGYAELLADLVFFGIPLALVKGSAREQLETGLRQGADQIAAALMLLQHGGLKILKVRLDYDRLTVFLCPG